MAGILLFDYAASTVEPPTGSQIRFNAAAFVDVSLLWIRNLTSDGVDAYYALIELPVDTRIYIQDKNDHTRYAQFTVTGPIVDKTTYLEMPVVHATDSGITLLAGQQVALVSQDASEASPIPPMPGIPLLTLATAKLHLRISDTAHDADVQLKADQASAIVVDYLKADADPTWTPETVPLVVQSTMLSVLACLYEHRGDDYGVDDPDAALWTAIEKRLARLRKPAYA
jgi:hypothetical protein